MASADVKCLLLACVLQLFACWCADLSAGPDKFGPFNASVTDTHLCQGPKRADCGRVTLTSSADLAVSSFVVALPDKVKIEQVKIVLYPLVGGRASRPDVSWRVPRPCAHVALAPSLHALYSTSPDCNVKKTVLLISMLPILTTVRQETRKYLTNLTDTQSTSQFQLAGKESHVKKGEYRFNVSFTSAIFQFAGAQFFYGTYRSKFLLLARDCNVMCLLNEIVLTKK